MLRRARLASCSVVNFSTFSVSANQTVVLTDRKELRDLRWHRRTARIPRRVSIGLRSGVIYERRRQPCERASFREDL